MSRRLTSDKMPNKLCCFSMWITGGKLRIEAVKATAACALILHVVLVAVASGAPSIHSLIHDDAQEPEHFCLISTFNDGGVSSSSISVDAIQRTDGFSYLLGSSVWAPPFPVYLELLSGPSPPGNPA